MNPSVNNEEVKEGDLLTDSNPYLLTISDAHMIIAQAIELKFRPKGYVECG